jgi:hypothetical protein
VLGRGYAVVRNGAGAVVRDAGELGTGERVDVLVATGSFTAVVETVDGRAGASPADSVGSQATPGDRQGTIEPRGGGQR